MEESDLQDSFPALDFGVSHEVRQIRIYEDVTCVLFYSNEVKCFGAATQRRLGTYVDLEESPPWSLPSVQAEAINFGTNLHAVHLFSGRNGAPGLCARLNTGDVKCWGPNFSFNTGIQTGISLTLQAALLMSIGLYWKAMANTSCT
jgi:hypothetical protein